MTQNLQFGVAHHQLDALGDQQHAGGKLNAADDGLGNIASDPGDGPAAADQNQENKDPQAGGLDLHRTDSGGNGIGTDHFHGFDGGGDFEIKPGENVEDADTGKQPHGIESIDQNHADRQGQNRSQITQRPGQFHAIEPIDRCRTVDR